MGITQIVIYRGKIRDNKLYEMIFKRKSFHLFRNIGNEHITAEEIKDIENEFTKLIPLVEDIKLNNKDSYNLGV